MTRVATHRLLASAALTALAACSGGGSSASAAGTGKFVVLNTDPVNAGRVYLNDPVHVDFSHNVEIDSANLDNFSFQVTNLSGEPLSEVVSGTFRIGTTPGDLEPGRRLTFVPRFATSNDFANGGFRGGRTYLVRLVGGSAYNRTALRNTDGKALFTPAALSFTTADGTVPAQLFRNPASGGPKRKLFGGLAVSNAVGLNDVPLNRFGAPPSEIRLEFDQALNPNDTNIPVNFDSNPLVRNINARGRVFLEYDDPVLGDNTWIPADVELERNDLDGAVLILRPVGVLPNNATIRVIVEPTVEDISGESNVAEVSYNRVFGTFRTQRSYDQQFNAIVDSFDSDRSVDFGEVFPEPLAEVGPGYIKAGFSFEGRTTSLEYEPTVREVVLNTAFTQIQPKVGQPFNVSGGVFNFRNVTIPQGVIVRGSGPNPMVWLCTGDFRVAGELTVRGGTGQRVDTLNSANFPKGGGVGVCGGGKGGDGTPAALSRDARGATGFGPLQAPGRGGRGGQLACTSQCFTGSGYADAGGGSGGGGGTMATQGDPRYDGLTLNWPASNAFQQKLGYGGAGCSGASGQTTNPGARTLPGGDPGDRVFVDTRADNNFWGLGINLSSNPNLRIRGEIVRPMGGGGGGGGGDTSHNLSCSLTDSSFANDYSGGGGGGGGGVLIVKALGEIEILPTGKIIADGGNGGGGEQAGMCGNAGGGGAGAGGMVVLMSAKRIIIHTHSTTIGTTTRYLYRGPTAIDKDYNFAISADGGICTTGTFTGPQVPSKYPAAGATLVAGSTYDSHPLGGFGGMGIVQLMVPPGENTDGTNTALDDNINIVLPTNPPTGLTKQSVIGWRGFPNAAGTAFVGDNGVAFTQEEGDIRPAPILMPVPFGAKSRLRSKWIDTGVSKRRPLGADDGQPRGLVVGGGVNVGPTYEFAGLNLVGSTPGYVDYETVGTSGTRIRYPEVIAPTNIATVDAQSNHLGEPAYLVTLASSTLGSTPNRYSGYEAELLNGSNQLLGSFRIMSHDDANLWLAPDSQTMPTGVARLRVRAKFFRVITRASEGLGPVYLPTGTSTPVPNANLRIGFAFHQDPQGPTTGRFPADPKQFLYNLEDAAFQSWIATNGAPRYVQWDVTFDAAFSFGGSTPPSISPESPLPELHFLRLPFRW